MEATRSNRVGRASVSYTSDLRQSAECPRNSFAARSHNLENETAAPTAIGTAGNELGRFGRLTTSDDTGPSPAKQWSVLFLNMHRAAVEPVLPQVAAARQRDQASRERIERGEFEVEPRADFAARLARVEFGGGVRRRAR